ncbi:hypothetical protein GW916_12080 [bacterium]|nr:hypothetical protein [bacterium]
MNVSQVHSYPRMKSLCEQDSFELKGAFGRGYDRLITCNLISQDGETFGQGDDHYRLVIKEMGPSEEEDVWDDLELTFNNRILEFAEPGSPDLFWDRLFVVDQPRSNQPSALVFERSFGIGMDNRLIEPHYYVVSLNREKTCLIAPSKHARHQGTQAFSSLDVALKAAESLSGLRKPPCFKMAKPLF